MGKIISCALAFVLATTLAFNPLCIDDSAYAAQETGFLQTTDHAFSRDADAMRFKRGNDYTITTKKSVRIQLVDTSIAVIWKSSNKRVATVSQKGVVYGKRPGITVVTARNALSGLTATCIVKVYRACTKRQAYRFIMALKRTYWPGRTWTNENYYFWQAKPCHCYGCAAFAGIASDAAFGKFAPLRRHASFAKVKPGDHVRIAGKHSVVVLRKTRQSIIVAEGNYGGVMRWGREITRSELAREGFYVETRYRR